MRSPRKEALEIILGRSEFLLGKPEVTPVAHGTKESRLVNWPILKRINGATQIVASYNIGRREVAVEDEYAKELTTLESIFLQYGNISGQEIKVATYDFLMAEASRNRNGMLKPASGYQM